MTESLQKIDPEAVKILQENLTDLYMQSKDCKACNGTGWRSRGGDSIGTWPCEFCAKPKRMYGAKTKRRTYTVTDEVHAELQRLGQGNASAGIREAVKKAND